MLPRQQLLHVDPKCQYKWQVRDTCIRAERAEAERDALRECVRAADAMRANLWMPSLAMAYDAARAKVKP